MNKELQMAWYKCGNKLLRRLCIPFVRVQSKAVCAASSILDKVAVGITNNPIYFHRLAPEGKMKSENKNVKNDWTTKQRNGRVMSLVCSGCDVDTLLSVMSVGS
jgi:hypothetical protein